MTSFFAFAISITKIPFPRVGQDREFIGEKLSEILRSGLTIICCGNIIAPLTERESINGAELCSNERIIFMGRKHYRRKPYNITELAEKHGLKRNTLWARLDKGMPIEAALTTPLEPRNVPMAIEHNGKVQSLKDWSRELEINYETLRTRIEHGWSMEDALTKKVRATHYEIKYRGETLNLKQFSNKIGMDRHIVSNLLKKGFTPEEIAEYKHSLCGGNCITTGPGATTP